MQDEDRNKKAGTVLKLSRKEKKKKKKKKRKKETTSAEIGEDCGVS